MNPKGNMLKEPSSSAAKSRHQAKTQNGKCTMSETGEKRRQNKESCACGLMLQFPGVQYATYCEKFNQVPHLVARR